MANNRVLETEIKLALPDEATYLRLRNLLGPPLRSVRQENRFLDGPCGELRSCRAVLRVRRERELVHDAVSPTAAVKERFHVTLKTEGKVRGAVHTRGEIEAEVTADPGVFSPNPDWLMTLDLEPVRALRRLVPGLEHPVDQGGFSNHRQVFAPPAGSVLLSGSLWELDRTEFAGGIVEYELEVEFRRPDPEMRAVPQRSTGAKMLSAAEAELYDLLRLWNVPAAPQPRSKYERWLSYGSDRMDRQRGSAGDTESDLRPELPDE